MASEFTEPDLETLKRDINSLQQDFEKVQEKVSILANNHETLTKQLINDTEQYFKGIFFRKRIPKENLKGIQDNCDKLIYSLQLMYRYLGFVIDKIKQFRFRIEQIRKSAKKIDKDQLPEEIQECLGVSKTYIKCLDKFLEKLSDALKAKLPTIDKEKGFIETIKKELTYKMPTCPVCILMEDYINFMKKDIRACGKSLDLLQRDENRFMKIVEAGYLQKAKEELVAYLRKGKYVSTRSPGLAIIGFMLFATHKSTFLSLLLIFYGLDSTTKQYSHGDACKAKKNFLEEARKKFKKWKKAF